MHLYYTHTPRLCLYFSNQFIRYSKGMLLEFVIPMPTRNILLYFPHLAPISSYISDHTVNVFLDFGIRLLFRHQKGQLLFVYLFCWLRHQFLLSLWMFCEPQLSGHSNLKFILYLWLSTGLFTRFLL
mgnify:CR=1 FL=1